jgi:hypothetical protein
MRLAVLKNLAEDKFLSGARWGVLFTFIVCSSVAKAAKIVVNRSVPAAPYSLADTRAVFTMQQRFWPNGEPIKVFTLSDNNPVHKDFVKNNLDMFPHQLRRVWDRMIFSGTGIAPIQLDSEQEMIEKIANTPNAIGYLNSRAIHEKIRLFEFQ